MSHLTSTAVDPWIYGSAKALRVNDEVPNAFGKWVMDMGPFEWFVTRTLDREKIQKGFSKPGLGTARACLRELLVHTQAERFVAVFEMHDDGVPHLHAVLGGCRGIAGGEETRLDAHKWGWSKWLVHKQGGGAARYLGKYLGKDYTELYVGRRGPWTQCAMVNHPDRRHSECFGDSTLGGLRV